jgi:DNA primase
MQRDGCTFWEALKTLAVRGGIQLPEQTDEEFKQALSDVSERREVEELLTMAAAYWHSSLPSHMRRLVKDTYGLSDETIDDLCIGYADGALWSTFVDVIGVDRDKALSTGLFVKRRNSVVDFFVGRIIFPYWRSGRVVYATGRKTEHTPDKDWERGKYKKLRLHSKTAPYISEHVTNTWFYNEDDARCGKSETLIITEGTTDCIAAMQAGFRVTSPGTTRFSKRDIPKIIDLTKSAVRVVICNDNEAPDQNGRRPGLDGAVETATALYEAGRDVRLAILPRQSGVAKVDLCDFLRDGGVEPFREVIQAAPTYPSYLIRQVSTSTPKVDLDHALRKALVAISNSGEAARDEYVGEVSKRFSLGKRVVTSMVKRITDEEKRERNNQREMRRLGAVWESLSKQVYMADSNGKEFEVSSFVIRPIRRLVLDEGGDAWEVDFVAETGRIIRAHLLTESFRSRVSLINALPSADLQWLGSDNHTQGLLRLLVDECEETVRGTKRLGMVDEDREVASWAAPGWKEGGEKVVWVDTGISLATRIAYPSHDNEKFRESARVILPLLPALNTERCMLPLIGWWFAASMRPRFQRLCGHFPFLCVHGTQGSGKTSLAQFVFWPMSGIHHGAPYSAGQTEFASLRLLSSTTSIPVVMDEYKPFSMPRARRDRLHQLLHENYAGSAPERGRADQSTVSYRLTAPLCMVGETRPSIPALIERIISSVPSKDALSEAKGIFSRVVQADPTNLVVPLVDHSLSFDVGSNYKIAKAAVEFELDSLGRNIPVRVADNLSIMVTGLISYQSFCERAGLAAQDVDVREACLGVIDDLFGEATSVHTALDRFIEELSVLSVMDKIRHGSEWQRLEDGDVAIHFSSCHSAFREHCKRIDHEGEAPDRQSLRRQAREEEKRSGGYVKEIARAVYFGQQRRRALVISVKRARLRGLEVDGFETTANYQGEVARWGENASDDGDPF